MMLPATMKVLRAGGFTKKDRVRRGEIADRCIEILLEKTIASSENEARKKAMTSAEFRHEIFGEVERHDVARELDTLLSSVLSAEGFVQENLENGYVLCSMRVTRMHGEGSPPITRPARFLTEDPDLVQDNYLIPGHDRVVRAAQSVLAKHTRAEKKIPALAGRRQEMMTATHGRITGALELDA